MTNNFIAICPFLSLSQKYDFGDFYAGPFSEFVALWTDSKLKDDASRFVSNFEFADGVPIENPTLIVRSALGVDGSPFSSEELSVIQLALDFAVIDSNPYYDVNAYNDGSRLTTPDNSEVQIWQVDSGEAIVLQRGKLVSIQDLQFVTSREVHISSSLETPRTGLTHLDAKLLDACVRMLRPGTGESAAIDSSHVQLAIRWLSKAWHNTTSLDWDDRIIMLKTAFEALTKSSKWWASAERIRRSFENLKTLDPEWDQFEQLLWSPSEPERWPHTYKAKRGAMKTETLTDLEDWFKEFASARNDIIHDGRVSALAYSRQGTAYFGPFFWTGERLLREAIKAELHHLGFPDLWRPAWERAGITLSRIPVDEF